MKVLFVTNTVKTYALVYKNIIDCFFEKKCVVFWAANFNNFIGDYDEIPCKVINLPINSNPLKKGNVFAYKTLKKIVKDENFDVIYCSTPIGSTIARLASDKSCKVIYAAHGFLFFKNSKKRFLNPLFRLHEKLLAKKTDVIITITDEDFEAAKRFKLKKNGKVYKINGAGIDLDNNISLSRNEKRKELGISEDRIILITAGYLNKNKNNIIILKALNILKDNRYCYLICGEGNQRDILEKYCKKHKLSDQVFFLGFRRDILDLFNASDIFLMPSYREGVPRSLLEALNLGLPCIGSKTRGINDLITSTCGFLCEPNNAESFANAILNVRGLDLNKCREDGKLMANQYSKEVVLDQIRSIFEVEINVN